jgi:aspartyl/asparaginyl-tRNA synthetase
VEDKALAQAKKENVSFEEVTRRNEEVFFKDLELLKKDDYNSKTPLPRIPYDEAVEKICHHGSNLTWGQDLTTEDEKLLGDIMNKEGIDFLFSVLPVGVVVVQAP